MLTSNLSLPPDLLRARDNGISLQRLIQKQQMRNPTLKIEDINHLVLMATSEILGRISPYTQGAKRITERQIAKICTKFNHLKDKLVEKIENDKTYAKYTLTMLTEMTTYLRTKKPDGVPLDKFYTSLREDYYEIMGLVVSYMNCTEGQVIPGPLQGLPDYQVKTIITNQEGLQIVVLTPLPVTDPFPEGVLPPPSIDEFTRPIYSCRGTILTTPHNLLDDLDPVIGKISFSQSKEELHAALKATTQEHGPAVITGHSLGGAVAQHITAEFCNQTIDEKPLIQETYHYCSPGVGESTARKYRKKVKNLPLEHRPLIYSYQHYGDIVSSVGGASLPAARILEVGRRSTDSLKKAHCWTQLISQFASRRVLPPLRLERRITRFFSEKVRLAIAGIFRKIIHRVFKLKIQQNAQKLNQFVQTWQPFVMLRKNLQKKSI